MAETTYRTVFKVINVHRHCTNASEEAMQAEIEVMDSVGISTVVILDGGQSSGTLPLWLKLRETYPHRLAVFANVDFKRINESSFFDNIVIELEAQNRLGVQGVKIFKELGMHIREPSGSLLKADDRRLDPFWAKCGELGRPVLIHSADPREYWYPLDYNTYHYGMRAEKPQHCRNSEMPSWEELIRQRDHVLEKHPNTTFIGAHMGSLTFELQRLEETLEKYSNFFVDCSARLRLLGRFNPMAVHDFVVKNQDRVLFGTDADILGPEPIPTDGKTIREWKDHAVKFYSRHLAYFETDQVDIIEPYGYAKSWLRLSGAKLPADVLEKFYHANAERLIPSLLA